MDSLQIFEVIFTFSIIIISMDIVSVPDPWYFDFGSDADPQIRTSDKRIRLRLLLFSSVTFKTQKKEF